MTTFVKMSEDIFARHLHRRERKARIEGAEMALKALLQEAGALFARRRDEEARALRVTADDVFAELLAKLKDEAAKHEELFPIADSDVMWSEEDAPPLDEKERKP